MTRGHGGKGIHGPWTRATWYGQIARDHGQVMRCKCAWWSKSMEQYGKVLEVSEGQGKEEYLTYMDVVYPKKVSRTQVSKVTR